MKNRKMIFAVAAGLVFTLIVAGSVLSRNSGPPEVAVDTTGETAGQTTPGSGQATAKPKAGSTQPAKNQTGATPTPTETPPPPAIIDVGGSQVDVSRGPIILLNPSTARQGSTLGVTGSGFDPGSTIDLVLKRQQTDGGEPVTFVQVDKSGTFGGINFTVPDTLPSGPFIMEARERKADGPGYTKTASVSGTIAGGNAEVKLGSQVGQAGQTVELSGKGFAPDEKVTVYFNALGSLPIDSFQTDGRGSVDRASVKVPFGAVGNNTLIFVGEKSQTPVTANFLLLSIFPSVELSNYAIKADNVLNFTGKDFGPGERVLVYLNNPNSQPIVTIQTEKDGSFPPGGGFVVPFSLRGQQTLIFIGEQSKAPSTASFDILPYTPNVQPSTYGGRPGTTVAFYGYGFARNEIVYVYIDRNQQSQGKMVACFGTDNQGNAGAGGQYTIPGNAQPGQLQFTFLGNKSSATTTTALEVMASDVPVQVPPQQEFTCPLDQAPQAPAEAQQTQPGQAGAAGQPAGSGQPAQPVTPQQPAQPAAPQQNQPSPTQQSQPTPAKPATPQQSQSGQQTQPAQPTQPAQQQQATPPAKSEQAPTPGSAVKATATPAPSPTPTPTPAPAEPSRTYSVKPGDTLSEIAQQFGTTVDAIVQANHIENPNLIQVGQQLVIPAAPSPATSAPTSGLIFMNRYLV